MLPFALPFSAMFPVSIASHRCNSSVARRSRSSSSSMLRAAPDGDSCCLLRSADTASKPLPLAGDVSIVVDRAGEVDEDKKGEEEREDASSGLSGAVDVVDTELCTAVADAAAAAGIGPRDSAERDFNPNDEDTLNCSLRSPRPSPSELAGAPPGPPRFHHTWFEFSALCPPPPLPLLLLPPPLMPPPVANSGSLLPRSSGDVGPPCRNR